MLQQIRGNNIDIYIDGNWKEGFAYYSGVAIDFEGKYHAWFENQPSSSSLSAKAKAAPTAILFASNKGWKNINIIH